MQILVNLAAQFDRKVAFFGRGMVENSQIAQRLGHLRIPAGIQIRDSEAGNYPAQDVLCLTTGSQGEPMSAMSRIAIDDHRHLKIAPDDTVVLSARSIPGNEKAIGRVLNHLARRGANVLYDGITRRTGWSCPSSRSISRRGRSKASPRSSRAAS